MIEHRSHTYGVLGEFDTEHHFLNAVERGAWPAIAISKATRHSRWKR